jgi:hypothetical protein
MNYNFPADTQRTQIARFMQFMHIMRISVISNLQILKGTEWFKSAPRNHEHTAERQWSSPVYRSVSSLSVASDFPQARQNEACGYRKLRPI